VKLLPLALLAACVPPPSAAPARLRAPADRGAQTVEVQAMCVPDDPFESGVPQISGGRGSGVLIDGRYVLTAHHVIDCSYMGDVHVITETGDRRRAVVDVDLPEDDVSRLVLMEAGPGFGPVAPPAYRPTPATPGERVCASHAVPERGETCGEVVITTDERGEDVVVTAPIEHGNSGGPVYDDSGHLVGLTTRLLTDDTGKSVGGRYVRLTPRILDKVRR
jgi:S1-C subfamily serine protease